MVERMAASKGATKAGQMVMRMAGGFEEGWPDGADEGCALVSWMVVMKVAWLDEMKAAHGDIDG